MAYLVDTNILVRLAVPSDPRHRSARRALEYLAEDEPHVTSQNLIEFWNVATRPARYNGLGQPIEAADQILTVLERTFPRLPDSGEVYDRWRGLVTRFGVSGVGVHDARLVACMLVHDVDRILTFNSADFRRYEQLGIRAIEPETLV